MSGRRILILDEIEVMPGMTAHVREAWRTQYRPGAQARGMVLQSAWQHPPVLDIPELPATLFYLWSVEGESGWWKQRLSRRPDGSDERDDKEAFWRGIAPMVRSRKRRMLTDIEGET